MAGAGSFFWAKNDLDARRKEKMRTEGPLYRVRQPKEGVKYENMEVRRIPSDFGAVLPAHFDALFVSILAKSD